MRPIWLIQIFLRYVYCARYVNFKAPPLEKEHDPERYTSTISPFIFGTQEKVPKHDQSPDFRIEEPLYLPYKKKGAIEFNRPYRLSPHYKVTSRWANNEDMDYATCYCTTVFNRLTLLSGCAVITTRHILTTATSTHLVLKDRYDSKNLEGILGAWYDTNKNTYNSSMYLTPARIHYHPLWHYPEDVNRSHPFSFTYDLAVWATSHNVYGYYLNAGSTNVCLRATSHSKDQLPPSPPVNEVFTVVGFQFIYAYRRKPMPWYKYGIRTKNYVFPCPKVEWGWFLCVYGNFIKYGIESGAPLHRAFKGKSWRYNGLVALGAFTMRLRSVELVHYFTILDNHRVLDFLFDTYRLNTQPIWKDSRFTHKGPYAPIARQPIPYYFTFGKQTSFSPYYD